jgi:hypothetical protein
MLLHSCTKLLLLLHSLIFGRPLSIGRLSLSLAYEDTELYRFISFLMSTSYYSKSRLKNISHHMLVLAAACCHACTTYSIMHVQLAYCMFGCSLCNLLQYNHHGN